jgi:hypothetical protein
VLGPIIGGVAANQGNGFICINVAPRPSPLPSPPPPSASPAATSPSPAVVTFTANMPGNASAILATLRNLNGTALASIFNNRTGLAAVVVSSAGWIRSESTPQPIQRSVGQWFVSFVKDGDASFHSAWAAWTAIFVVLSHLALIPCRAIMAKPLAEGSERLKALSVRFSGCWSAASPKEHYEDLTSTSTLSSPAILTTTIPRMIPSFGFSPNPSSASRRTVNKRRRACGMSMRRSCIRDTSKA